MRFKRNNFGDSSTPKTWAPTSDSIRDERIDAELEELDNTRIEPELSNCCGAPKWGETDLCSQCLEHASWIEEGDEYDES